MKKEMTKAQKYLAVIVLIFVTAFGMQFAINRAEEKRSEDTLQKVEEQTTEVTKSKAMVQVAGEVHAPGIYEAELDMRVIDVITMAGGFTDKANQEKVNLVAYVKDGQKIDVPAIKETSETSKSSTTKSSAKSSTKSAASKSTGTTKKTAGAAQAKTTATPKPTATPTPTPPELFTIAINTASVDDFAAIKGISREIAEAIVRYRNEYGAFASVENLLDVPGVTMKIYHLIEPFVQTKTQ